MAPQLAPDRHDPTADVGGQARQETVASALVGKDQCASHGTGINLRFTTVTVAFQEDLRNFPDRDINQSEDKRHARVAALPERR